MYVGVGGYLHSIGQLSHLPPDSRVYGTLIYETGLWDIFQGNPVIGSVTAVMSRNSNVF